MTSRWLHSARVSASITASSLRVWRGTLVRHRVEPPVRPLQLFDFEACPHCRPVREALTELDLDVEVYPCPRGGSRHRPRARQLLGRESFPTLHDPAVGLTICGRQRVLEHLFARFANRATPLRFRLGLPSSRLATGVSALRGRRARPSRPAERLLELYGFESSPYSRLVRERLCELELAYLLHNLGKEQIADIGMPGLRLTVRAYEPKPGGKREALKRLGGEVQVPYLVDPNTGSALYESRAIVDYLERTYAL
jgi:glutathione S-transferase